MSTDAEKVQQVKKLLNEWAEYARRQPVSATERQQLNASTVVRRLRQALR